MIEKLSSPVAARSAIAPDMITPTATMKIGSSILLIGPAATATLLELIGISFWNEYYAIAIVEAQWSLATVPKVT